MIWSIRRLGNGDEVIVQQLAHDDADFDLAERGAPLQPLDTAAAQRYLTNPAVLHWVALADDLVVGSLYCILLPLRAGAGQELLLYEIGVRSAWRRRGIGRALATEMERWMRANDVDEVWVLADNEDAISFYRACGFAAEPEQPRYLIRSLTAAD